VTLADAQDPVGALILPNRHIVVLDRGAPGLLLHDSTGVLLGRAGNEGAGPGEFRLPQALAQYRGDSIAVFDEGLRRVQVFDDSLGFGRAVPIEAGISRVSFVGTDLAGSFVFRGEGFEDRGRRWREPAEVFRVPAAGGGIDSVATLPGWQYYRVRLDGRPAFGITPFGPRTLISAGPRGIAVHLQNDCSILVYASSSRPDLIVQSPCQRRALPAEDFEAFRAERIARMRRAVDREWVTRLYRSRQLPVPSTVPPFERLLHDPDGLLWVAVYALLADEVRRWWVFDLDARWLGELTVPIDIELAWIGRSEAIGIVEVETGEKVVTVHALRRGTK